jgi:hypothetical protein
MVFSLGLSYVSAPSKSVSGTANIKCSSIERVVMSAPVNGVVSMVCRAQ